MKHEFLDLIKQRRSRYDLTNQSTLPKDEIVQLLEQCVLHMPSPFNSQSTRVLLLCGVRHPQFWQLVKHELQSVIPLENFAPTEEKLSAFAAAHGTILFFEDQRVVEALKAQFPTYKDHFAYWSNQANALTQFAVWTSLAENGMGASLQHYNPLIDLEVHRQFHVSLDWKLMAQMPFGVPLSKHAPDKTFLPVKERVLVACP